MGLSGGGWTTTLAAALDPRIDLSIPIAGSIPCNFGHTSIDFEQFCERPYNQVCDYECQYVLRSSLCRKVFLESAPALIPTTFLGADTCSPVWRGSATRCRSSTSSTRAVSTATAGTRRSRSTIGGCNRRSRGTLKRARPWDTSTRWGKRLRLFLCCCNLLVATLRHTVISQDRQGQTQGHLPTRVAGTHRKVFFLHLGESA